MPEDLLHVPRATSACERDVLVSRHEGAARIIRSARRDLRAHLNEYGEDAEPAPFTEEGEAIYWEALGRISTRFGRASVEEMRVEIGRAIRWCQHNQRPDEEFEQLAWSVVHSRLRKFRLEFPRDWLAREFRDQQMRDAAMNGGAADVTRYLVYDPQDLRGRSRAYPRRWFVRGRNVEELYSEFELKMLTLITPNVKIWREPWSTYERPGLAATYVLFDRTRRAMQKRSKLTIVTHDPPGAVSAPSPSALEQVIEKETPIYLRGIIKGARVSRIQRVWLDAMYGDFVAHGRLNMTRVAETLGKSVAAGTRMRAALKKAIGKDFDTKWFNERD